MLQEMDSSGGEQLLLHHPCLAAERSMIEFTMIHAIGEHDEWFFLPLN